MVASSGVTSPSIVVKPVSLPEVGSLPSPEEVDIVDITTVWAACVGLSETSVGLSEISGNEDTVVVANVEIRAVVTDVRGVSQIPRANAAW